jgi:hypothetical protein
LAIPDEANDRSLTPGDHPRLGPCGMPLGRGQVASKLKRFGIELPITDFYFWPVEQMRQEK